jgi:transposase
MRPNLSNQKSPSKKPAEQVVKDIRRATRRHFSAEDKIRIVLEGLRGEDSIAELCRKEGIAQSLYYVWSKEFMEAGKRRLDGDTARAATTDEVKDLRREASALKDCVADLTLENRLLKKVFWRMGATTNEVSCIRKARDHQARPAVAPACQADHRSVGHRPADVLPLV